MFFGRVFLWLQNLIKWKYCIFGIGFKQSLAAQQKFEPSEPSAGQKVFKDFIEVFFF